MQTTLNRLTSPVRSLTTGTWVVLFAVLALCLVSVPAMATGSQPIVVSANTTIGYFPAGGQEGSQIPLSDTFVVGANGHVIVTDEWGGDVLEIDPTQPATSAATKLAEVSNVGPAAVDQYGNVYVAYDGYNASIFKIPYNASTGKYTGFTTAPTATCLGTNQDTAPCIYATSFQAVFTNGSGYADLVFDNSGNLIIATSTVPTDNPNTIYLCNASCQTGSGAPTKIYADPNPIGALAVDPWGNLFFSDGNNSKGKATNLNELPYVSGAYAAAPTVLESYTNAAGYGNGFSGVAINGTGTVYFVTNADGIYAIPNTKSGGPNLAGTYAVGLGGGYAIALDRTGNLYEVHYVGTPPSGDANYGVDEYFLNNVSLGATTIGGTATTASVNVLDSNGACTPTLSASPVEFGKATTEFGITPGSSCGAVLGTGNGTISPALALAGNGAAISGTITFNAVAAGERNAALVITDSTNSATGTAALTGVGQSAAGAVDPGVATAYSTGLTTPTSVVADPAGDIFVADSGAAKVYEIAMGSSSLTQIGTGFTSPCSLAFDASGNLFVADNGLPGVYEIANTGTTGAFVAGTQSQVAGPSAAPGGTAIASATALAVGPDGTLYLSDPTNKRVVYYNLLTGQAGVTLATTTNGITTPAGIAVDGSGNLYVADSSADKVFIFSTAGVVSSVTPPNVTTASGVAVDASGSILVSDSISGNIVRIPDISGTLTTSQALVIDTVASKSASSLSMDAQGGLYVASTSGKAAYAIQRTAAAVDLGTVQDGVTNSATAYLENVGNLAATLATPSLTQPTNTMFTLAAPSSGGCTSGASGPAGTSCIVTATFAPPVGTANGAQTGSGTINISTPALTFTVNMTGTATPSSILSQTITNFNPPTSLQVGQQITLSATGGASGQPVVFSIDASSACPTCATISGSTLTAVAAGSVKVDANQAGGTANGNQYAAATQVQAPITISNNLVATGVPALLMNQANWLSALPNGGAYGGAGSGGTSFAVNPAGNPVVSTSYGSSVELYNVKTATWTKLGSVSNVAGLAQDSAGDLYLGANYSGVIAKLPYNRSTGTYATLTDPTATTPPQCTGSDTAECAAVTGFPSYTGVNSMTVDSSGNLFVATDDQGSLAHSIWECSAACQTGASAPVMLYQETATSVTVGGTPYTIQYYIGGMGVDPWGNLFFTDSAIVTGGSGESATSHLNELVYTSGSGYAANPTVIQTFTNTKPAGYDDQLDGVAVAPSGAVYYGMGYDGVFGIPNTQTGGPKIANQYGVVNQGVKEMAVDSSGNVYWVAYYSGGDTLGQALIGDVVTPIAQLQGAPVSTSANVLVNAFSCSTPATIAIASSNSEFSATAGATCSSVTVGSGNGTLSTPFSGSSYSATINFAATKGGPQTSTLSLSDTANGGTGTATVTGIGQETPQTLSFTAPTTTTVTYSPGLTVTVSVKNGGSNNPVVFTLDSTSTGVGTFSSTTVTGTTSTATLTVTQAGNIVIDANEVGGLVSGIYYDAATQAQLTLVVNKASQAIVFPQPTTPITYSPTLTASLSANGGASGNAVVFTVDASSTGAGTVSTSTLSNGTSTATLTVTKAGNIVIDANQAGTANYSAAAQVQQTIVVNQASQTIAFNPITTPSPLHYITTCAVASQCAIVTFTATGGGTNNPITLTADASSAVRWTLYSSSTSGATTTATVELLPGQTLTYPASLIIDLNQAGNSNYSAATQLPVTISVQSPLPAQTVTFSQPQTQVAGTTLTLSATASSGFPVTYASSTTSVCTVSGSTVTFLSSVTSTSVCTITAAQPGDNIYYGAAVPVSVTFAVNAAGKTPSMTLGLSLSSLTIEKGTVGLTQLNLGSVNNFAASQVAFACSGLPSGYSCSFNPTSTAAFAPGSSTGLPAGATAATTLTVMPPASSAVVRPDFRPLFPATLAVALCFLGIRKRNRLFLLVMLVVLLAGFGLLSGCGGTSGSSSGTSTTSQITVSATGGGSTVSSGLTVIVR